MHLRKLAAAALAAAILVPAWVAAPDPAVSGETLHVFKDANCGCCEGWMKHMRAAGFDVQARDLGQPALAAKKAAAGISGGHASCHTAFVGGYVIEGHVPAEDVRRLLAERPEATGLAVPGMPAASPGMDMGSEPYEVLLVGDDGSARVFARH